MKHQVIESKLRSILRVITGRALEISIGTGVISFLLLRNLALSFATAVLSETVCAATSYVNNRLWNKTQWGLRVIHVKEGKKT